MGTVQIGADVSTIRRRTSALALAAAAAAMLTATSLVPTAASAETVPPWRAERAISTASFPGVGAWGLAYNPVTDEFAVGDYLLSQVRRFSRSGEYLGDFTNPTPTAGGVVSGLANDPTTGATYVAITGEGRTSLDVRKYDAQGRYMFGIDTPKSTTWVGTGPDGALWVPEAYAGAKLRRYKVDDATQTATLELTIDNPGSGPGQFGQLTSLGSDTDGNIYVSDPKNRTVHSYTRDGVFRFDLGGPALFPGDMRGVIVDSRLGRVYVANSSRATIEVFSTATGAHLSTFGSEGSGPGQFVDGARQLAVTPDSHLWAADYGQFRVIEFDENGQPLSDFPHAGGMRPDPAGLSSPRGLDVDPVTNEVVVANSWGQRVQRFAADGELLQTFGRRGSAPPVGMNYPKSVAIDPATRTTWVGNYEGIPHVVGFAPGFTSVVGKVVPQRFTTDLTVADGKLYVVNRRPGALAVYDLATSAKVRSWTAPPGLLRGIDIDPATGNAWMTQETKKNLLVLSPSNVVLKTIPMSGSGWGVAVRGDLVYVANTTSNTVDVFDRVTYAQVGTIGARGTRLGQFSGPTAVSFGPDGKLYVLEERGGRVQVLTTAPAPPRETQAPVATHDLASTGVVDGEIVVSGSASDDTNVDQVEVAVQDTTTGRYFDIKLGAWVARMAWNQAASWGPGPSVSWRSTTPLTLPGRSYTVRVRALDPSGTYSKVATRSVVVP